MADDLKCKLKILGADPNNPKKPARFSGDPSKRKAQKMKLAACRSGRRQDFKNKILDKGKDLVNKVESKIKKS